MSVQVPRFTQLLNPHWKISIQEANVCLYPLTKQTFIECPAHASLSRCAGTRVTVKSEPGSVPHRPALLAGGCAQSSVLGPDGPVPGVPGGHPARAGGLLDGEGSFANTLCTWAVGPSAACLPAHDLS